MRGIKIPQQNFALKMQGGGGVFAGHYGITVLLFVSLPILLTFCSIGSEKLKFCATH